MKKVLVIIPTYNEAQNIQPIIEEIFQVSKDSRSWDLEVLVADDHSSDGTDKIVKNLQKKHKKLHLISGKREGIGKAYIRGFRYGLKNKDYFAFVMIDADFSHDPHAIPDLLLAIANGADYVIGSRYISGGQITKKWSKANSLNSRLANMVARLLIDSKDVSDMTAGFKAIRRTSIENIALNNIRAKGYVFQVSLLHEFMRRNLKVLEIPITFTNRRYGASKRRLRDVLEFIYLTYHLNPGSRIRRLFRFSLVGACGTLVNLLIITIMIHIFHRNALLSDAVAIEISIIFNFFMNHLYTFRAKYSNSDARAGRDSVSSILEKLGKFNLVSLGGALISFIVFVFCYKILDIHYIFADILGIILALSWNYWMSVTVVWKVIDK